MKLQVALDFFKLEDAIALMCKIHPFVDIAEIGTPLVLSEGFRHESYVPSYRYSSGYEVDGWRGADCLACV